MKDATINSERESLLRRLDDKLEIPMLILSFVWLILMIVEFTSGLLPFLARLNDFIWLLFIADFSIKIILAENRLAYLKRNWITAIALLLPAFRIFRIARALRLLRTVRLARVLTSLNRGIGALGRSLSRRGFGYVFALTLIVTFAGAAGMLAFERDSGGIGDYGTALWWTAMILTTMGSDYFPKTSEGCTLCLILAIYGFAVFGYVTAAVATYFVGREAQDPKGEMAGQKAIEKLSAQVERLSAQIEKLSRS